MAELTPPAVLVAAIRYARGRTAQERQTDIAGYITRSARHYEPVARAWLLREVVDLLAIHGQPGAVAHQVWGPTVAALSQPPTSTDGDTR